MSAPSQELDEAVEHTETIYGFAPTPFRSPQRSVIFSGSTKMLEQKTVALTKDTLFKRPLTRMEARNATTDEAAKTILQREKAEADAKTQRLRAARLAREQNEQS